jgi:hypothetical protein
MSELKPLTMAEWEYTKQNGDLLKGYYVRRVASLKADEIAAEEGIE